MKGVQLTIDFEVRVEVDDNKRYFDLLEETYAKDEDEPWWNY